MNKNVSKRIIETDTSTTTLMLVLTGRTDNEVLEEDVFILNTRM